MRTLSLISLVTIAVAALRATADDDNDGNPPVGVWRPARPGDVRSPCTMLNILANHGHFPRNGRGLTFTQARAVFGSVINLPVPFQFAVTDTVQGQLFASSLFTSRYGETYTQPSEIETFDLDQVNVRGLAENDLSYFRYDQVLGNTDQSVQPELYKLLKRYFAKVPNSSGGGGGDDDDDDDDDDDEDDSNRVITYDRFKRFRQKRYEDEVARRAAANLPANDPQQIVDTDFVRGASAGTCVFIFELFGRGGILDDKTARSVWSKEQLPKGYVKRDSNEFFLAALNALGQFGGPPACYWYPGESSSAIPPSPKGS